MKPDPRAPMMQNRHSSQNHVGGTQVLHPLQRMGAVRPSVSIRAALNWLHPVLHNQQPNVQIVDRVLGFQ